MFTGLAHVRSSITPDTLSAENKTPTHGHLFPQCSLKIPDEDIDQYENRGHWILVSQEGSLPPL